MATDQDRDSRSEELHVAVRERGTTTAIELQGAWDLAGVENVERAISRALNASPECIVLDLSRLTFIDSSGIHATIKLTGRSAAQNTRLMIVPGPRPIQRIFEISGLLERLPFMHQEPRAATAHLPRPRLRNAPFTKRHRASGAGSRA